MRFNKIAIIGVGLIGGSIGLAVKKKKLAKEVVGVCRHQSSLNVAKKIKAIDRGTLNYKEAVGDADLTILAVPIGQITKIAKAIAPHLKKGCLVIDTGSTKEEIVAKLEKVLPKDVYFVGTHPLAGSEKRSVKYARANLFKGEVCILTKTKKTEPAALKKISSFWKELGCAVKVKSPQEHDEIVAFISHLPHLAAFELVKTAKGTLEFAASGFLDTTRIASSDAEIWKDIFLTNKKFINKAVDKYIKNLQSMKKLIANGDKNSLFSEFKSAKKLRDALQK